ncbi:MAG: hypothetical protein LC804_12855 [Acidobacteria bacterium]|nr:hypothetical protein [Acidobacteriota bacterium]
MTFDPRSIPPRPRSAPIQLAISSSAASRLAAARAFVRSCPAEADIVIVAPTRGAADDFARSVVGERGATFGVHRFSLTQLAGRLAAPALAVERLSPTSALGTEAIAARAAFEAARAGSLAYFAPVASMPGFPRALGRTLEELALAFVAPSALRPLGPPGEDVSDLLERFEEQFARAGAVDRAAFFRAAAAAASTSSLTACPLILLDLALDSHAEREFIRELARQAPSVCATLIDEDEPACQAFDPVSRIECPEVDDGSLSRARRYLFAADVPAGPEPDQTVEVFSAPGEARECVEIARRILREAADGVQFDQMAILLRTPQHYLGLLEHALRRAGIPAHFERGTKRPDPAGRAFLALVDSALDRLSARRFAEYLSLGQIPEEGGAAPREPRPAPTDEALGSVADRAGDTARGEAEQEDADRVRAGGDEPISREGLRAPGRWEALLIDAGVIGGEARWRRRLDGLKEEFRLQHRELQREESGAALEELERKIRHLEQFTAFALPLIGRLAAWPAAATWGEWLDLFEDLALRALARPSRVRRVLADLRPMAAIGGVALAEARQVVGEHLMAMETEPAGRRYGKVFVGAPDHARGRSFAVTFVPGLAERTFPQKLREDPLLIDERRDALGAGVQRQPQRTERERLHLRIAVGSATARLYVSFPTLEVNEGRPRVPSLYALELWRAVTGRVSPAELQRRAAGASRATLAWPAPDDPRDAIDTSEHDIATVRALLTRPAAEARGRAQYLLQENASLQRSVRERYMRARPAWSHWDGLTRVTAQTAAPLAALRLSARPYSPSALQRFAECPYQPRRACP